MAYFLTDKVYNDLKKFEPEYYDILAQYLWYKFNVLNGSYESYVKYEVHDDGKICMKVSHSIEVSRSDCIKEDRQETLPYTCILKDASIVHFLKESKYEYAFLAGIGFLFGCMTCFLLSLI